MIPRFCRTLLKRFLLLMAAYSATRLLYLFWNWAAFHECTWGEIGRAFLIGFRFDTAAIFFTNAILILFWIFLPVIWHARPRFRFWDRLAFTVINGFFLGLNFIDVEFNRFIGKRLSIEYFELQQDVREQAGGIFLSYWPLFLMLAITIAVIWWLYPVAQEEAPRCLEKPSDFMRRGGWCLSIITIVVIGMRGGVGLKPILPMEAYFSTKHELGLLTLNTPFNLIKSRLVGEVVTEKFLPDDREVLRRARKMTELTRPPLAVTKGWNVVILILESFSSEDIGAASGRPGYTPFLDELAKKSYFFKYNFANGTRSVDGIPAVFCGLPGFMGESIIMSDFSNNRMDCLAKILHKRGYVSYFLHGAHNGSMHFDSFSPLAGFDHFVGENEFPYKQEENIDPYWGIADEPMLQYAAEVIDKAPKPVFLGLFTLSSHHPYFIPKHMRGKFPKGTRRIHESMGYTDYSLRKFFETASTKPWFNKTIFVLTADHTHPVYHQKYLTTLAGEFRTPLFFYIPGLKKKLDYSPDRITQQIDVLPSVLDLLGISKPDHLLIGQSVFDQGNPGRAYDYTDYGYWYIDHDYFIDFWRGSHRVKVYRHKNTWNFVDAGLTDPEIRKLPEYLDLLSAVQYYDDGIANNSFYNWRSVLAQQ